MKFKKNTDLLLRLIAIPVVIILVLVLIIKAALWLRSFPQSQPSPAPRVLTFGIIIPKGYSVHGIDVSKHQADIDWVRVSRMRNNGISINFAFIKATEGITRQDHKFDKNWKGAARNGILRGAYHFYYPSRDADKQAQNFISKVHLSKGDLPPVADIELSNVRSAVKIREGLQVFLNKLEKQYKVKPIIYTNIHFYNTYLKGSFNDYPLWIAGYFDHDRFYSEFSTSWILWQHSEKGKVDGIRGNVDFNVFNGNLEKLRKFCL